MGAPPLATILRMALNRTSDSPDEARSDRIGEIARDRRAPLVGAPTEGITLGDGMMGLGLKISRARGEHRVVGITSNIF